MPSPKTLNDMITVTFRNIDWPKSMTQHNALGRYILLKGANLNEHISFVVDEKLNDKPQAPD